MTHKEIKKEFEQMILQSGKTPKRLSAKEGIQYMLDFHRLMRVKKCSVAKDDDALLFEWGIDSDADAKHLYYHIIRQLTVSVSPDHDEMYPLSLTFKFNLQKTPRLKGGNKWCWRIDHLDSFAQLIADHPSTKIASKQKAGSVKLWYSLI